MKQLSAKQNGKTFVQTERKTHEEWARLTLDKPSAAALMHVLVSRVGDNNAIVASYATLAEILGISQMTIRRAVEVLKNGRWIEVNRIGGAGTANAYVLNDKVAWITNRSNLKYSLFTATVIASGSDQPDHHNLEQRPSIRRLPRIGELQLPSGEGLPPPSQPFFDGMDPELPAGSFGNDVLEDDFQKLGIEYQAQIME